MSKPRTGPKPEQAPDGGPRLDTETVKDLETPTSTGAVRGGGRGSTIST